MSVTRKAIEEKMQAEFGKDGQIAFGSKIVEFEMSSPIPGNRLTVPVLTYQVYHKNGQPYFNGNLTKGFPS